jgi:hypothetical protein
LQHPPFPKPWCEPPNRAPGVPAARTDGSILRHQCRPLSPSGCLRTRLRIPPSLSWRNIGACRAPGPRNSLSRGSRCIVSLAASPSRRSACETPSDRSLRGESRRSDGTATTLRSSRADFAGFRGCRAFGTSMRRWGCAGRSYPSHWSSRSPRTWWERGELEKSPDMVGARRMARARRADPTPSWHGSHIGMCLYAQKVIAKSGTFGW